MGKPNDEPDVSDIVVGTNTLLDPENVAATDMISEFVKQTIDNIQHEFDDKPDNDRPNK